MIRYVHTNIIARDVGRLIEFYKKVLDCRSLGETRDLQGAWLDRLTGIEHAHVTGEHLALPGYEGGHPTLEIFSYDEMIPMDQHEIHRCGLAHLAFEVSDVKSVLAKILEAGGGQIGEMVHASYKNGRKAAFVYATDPEGNILELQSWH